MNELIKRCRTSGCDKPARAAVLTRRPTRDNVYLKVWTDERVGSLPKEAVTYCKQHALETVASLMNVLVDADES